MNTISKHSQLSTTIYLFLMTKMISRSLLKYFFKKNQRSAEQVKKEYDIGSWLKTLQEKKWDKYDNIVSFVTRKGAAQSKLCIIKGQVQLTTIEEYYTYKRERLSEIIFHWSSAEDSICELGCGAGFNILSLASSDGHRKFMGFDISKNGILAATEAAQYFKINNVMFGLLDLLDDQSAVWKELEGKVIFTHFCLEQLTRAIPKVIENMVKARPKRVIHIETSWDLLNGGLVDWATKLHVLGLDYQRNLQSTLSDFEKAQKIKIIKTERLDFAPLARNFPTLNVWEPN